MLRRLLSALALVAVAGSASAQFPDSLDPFNKGAACGIPCTIKTSIAAYYKLEEASGTRVDSSGNGIDLSATNTPGNTTGKVGNAVQLVAASSQRLDSASSAAYNPTLHDLTITGWLYFDTKGANRSAIGILIPSSSAVLVRYASGSDRLVFQANGIDVLLANTFGSPPLTTQMFVAVRHTRTSKLLEISVNGGAWDTATGVTAAINGTGPVRIGANGAVTPAAFWNGRVDEVGIWSRLLTNTEIAYLYASGSGITLYAGLRDFWFPGLRYAARDFGLVAA